jgi:hypothetical protein
MRFGVRSLPAAAGALKNGGLAFERRGASIFVPAQDPLGCVQFVTPGCQRSAPSALTSPARQRHLRVKGDLAGARHAGQATAASKEGS